MAISKLQLMQMAAQLKGRQGAQNEAQALEQLAQTGLSGEQQAQLRDMMRDKDKLRELMASPQAQALMKMMKTPPSQEGN